MLMLSFLYCFPPPLSSRLFPYTTLFRSQIEQPLRAEIFSDVAVDARVVRRRVSAHQLHRTPILLALLRIQEYRSEEHTSELQSHHDLVCRLLLEKKKIDDRAILRACHPE